MRNLDKKKVEEGLEEQTMQKLELSLKNLRVADAELFISAARMGNLGKAAKIHFLSQSAASTAIFRLETAFNIALCTHQKKKFTLTNEGEILLLRLEKWIEQLKKMVLKSEDVPIRIVTTHAISIVAVPGLFSLGNVEFKNQRIEKAYTAVLHDEADIALVLDNASWSGLVATEVGRGTFQLYSKDPHVPLKGVLLPEDQMEVLALQQTWKEVKGYFLPVKARIPSWSLIANICFESDEVGFLPDFLAKKYHLHPVMWQPPSSRYRILVLHKNTDDQKEKFERIITRLKELFS